MFDLDWYKMLVWTFILAFCIFVWALGFRLGSGVITKLFGG